MKRLLEKILGRSSPEELEPRPVASALPDAREGAGVAGAAAPSDPEDSRAMVIQALRQRLVEGSRGRLRADEIDEDGPLFDRGYLDSFSYVEFMAFIENTYRVRIDDSQLAGHLNTLSAMAGHVVRHQAPPTP